MEPTFVYLLALLLCAVSFAHTWKRWQATIKNDARTRQDCIDDMRAMNTYNSYVLSAIIVFLGLAFRSAAQPLPQPVVILAALALVTASFSLYFNPLARYRDERNVAAVKQHWLWKLINTQWTLILAILAIVTAALALAQQ
jgi:hypothetical protein